MRVVVTGAAGFIGSQLSVALLRDGHQVVGVDRLGTGGSPEPRLGRAWAALAERAGFVPVVGDLLSLDLDPLLTGADAVVHLAGRAGTHDSWTDYGGYLRDNVEATAVLLDACVRTRVPHLVHGSSSSVYGRIAAGLESDPLVPASPYAVSKLAAEATVTAYAVAGDLRTTIVRFFSVYGVGQRPDMGIYRAVQATLTGRTFTVFGDGRQTRTLTHVSDVAAGILGVLAAGVGSPAQRASVVGQVFNLGGTQTVSMLDVLDEIERLSGQRTTIAPIADPPGNQRHVLADSGRAARVLGYLPRTSVHDGLAEQIAWQRSLLPVHVG